jgi:hypothetical protein
VSQLNEFLNILSDWVTSLRQVQEEGAVSGTEEPVWYTRKAMRVVTWWNEWQITVSTINPRHKEDFGVFIQWASKPPMSVPKMVISSIEQLGSVLRGIPPVVEGKIGEGTWRCGGIDINGLHGGVPMEIMEKMWNSPDGALFDVAGVAPQKVVEKINDNLRKITKKSGSPVPFRASYLKRDQTSSDRVNLGARYIRRTKNPLRKGDTKGDT